MKPNQINTERNKPISKEALDHGREAGSVFLTEAELAKRWRLSKKKLQADRLQGRGPAFIKVGRLVRYRLADILDYEALRKRASIDQGEDQ